MNRYNAIIVKCIAITIALSFSNALHANTTSSVHEEVETEIRYEVLSADPRNDRTERKVSYKHNRVLFHPLLISIHKSHSYQSLALILKRHVWIQAFLL